MIKPKLTPFEIRQAKKKIDAANSLARLAREEAALKQKEADEIDMAKRADMTADVVEMIEDCGKEIVALMQETVFEIEGPRLTAVKYKDGNFKQKTIPTGMNFMMQGCYLGSKGKLIFIMVPEDSQEYESAELIAKDMDAAFPLAGADLATLLNLPNPVGEDFNAIVDFLITNKGKQRLEEEKASNAEYEANPLFGAF